MRSREARAPLAPRRRGRSRARDRDRATSRSVRDEGEGDAKQRPHRRPLRAVDVSAVAGARPLRDATRQLAGGGALVSGTVELLPNGSGFVRVAPPEPSTTTVTSLRRAGAPLSRIVSGDEVAGPVRAPRRSERYPSLIPRRHDQRPRGRRGRGGHEVRRPSLHVALDASRSTTRTDLKAIEWLTPSPRSRVVIAGARAPARPRPCPARRRAHRQEDLEAASCSRACARWRSASGRRVRCSAAVELGLGCRAGRARAGDRACHRDRRRVAARGGTAVVLIELARAPPRAARAPRPAAARNIVDGGSLTIIATAGAPVGGETTVIALDAALTASGRIPLPALDLTASATLHAGCSWARRAPGRSPRRAPTAIASGLRASSSKSI